MHRRSLFLAKRALRQKGRFLVLCDDLAEDTEDDAAPCPCLPSTPAFHFLLLVLLCSATEVALWLCGFVRHTHDAQLPDQYSVLWPVGRLTEMAS